MHNKKYETIILGGGPAGLTAAIYTSRASLDTLVVSGQEPGGQLMETTGVENYPGFPGGIQGPELMENFRKQAEEFGTEFVDENVVSLNGSFEDGFEVETNSGKKFTGLTIIVATGASARWLPLKSVEKLRGKGVSACATCDAFFFKDKITAVVGGGDAAMEEATFLTKFSPKVYVFVRKGKGGLRASEIMKQRAFDNDKIEFMFNTEVKEVLGESKVEGVVVFNNQTNKETKLEDIEGLFMAIGHTPNTDFLEGFVELSNGGYIEPIDFTKTSKEGVFVAGDVGDRRYQQAVTAAGFGCMASLDAEKFIAEHSGHEVVRTY